MKGDLKIYATIALLTFISVGLGGYLLLGNWIMAKASFITCLILFLWAWGFENVRG